MNLSELLEAVELLDVTDEDIARMNERLAKAQAEFEQELKDKTPTWDWYHQIYSSV